MTADKHDMMMHLLTTFISPLYSSNVSTAMQERWIGLRHASLDVLLNEKMSIQLDLLRDRSANTIGSLDPRYNLYSAELKLNVNCKQHMCMTFTWK